MALRPTGAGWRGSGGGTVSPKTVDVAQSADPIGRTLLAIKPGENVAIVCDDDSAMEMVDALASVASGIGAEGVILHQPSRPPERKNELSPLIAAALEKADVLIGLTGSGRRAELCRCRQGIARRQTAAGHVDDHA